MRMRRLPARRQGMYSKSPTIRLRTWPLGRPISLGVSAAFAGFLISGLMEWNLGDEELLDLLCVLVGIAFGAVSWARHRAARAGAEPLAIGGAPDQLEEAARAVGVTSRLR